MPEKKLSNPKFERHITNAVQADTNRRINPRFGLIAKYDKFSNTATVALMSQNSDVVESILEKVPCPMYPGLQMASPRPGQPCWIVFKGTQSDARPVITHYFSHDYSRKEYLKHYSARNGVMQFTLAM